MRLGYKNIRRYPEGYFGWKAANAPEEDESKETPKLTVGDYFPSCRLVLLDQARDREYLEIGHKGRAFSLEDIKSEYLFIELYNEMCSACINEVKNYKGVYRRLVAEQDLNDRVKMMGIGVGSKKRKVAKFRKKKGIPFPLFADEGWEIFRCLGDPLLPTSYLVQRQPNGGRKILLVQSGHIDSVEGFMKKMECLINKSHASSSASE